MFQRNYKICSTYTTALNVRLQVIETDTDSLLQGAIGTGTLAHNVSLLARYVSPVKSLKVQEKSFQAFVCFYLNAIELKKKFESLNHQGH